MVSYTLGRTWNLTPMVLLLNRIRLHGWNVLMINWPPKLFFDGAPSAAILSARHSSDFCWAFCLPFPPSKFPCIIVLNIFQGSTDGQCKRVRKFLYAFYFSRPGDLFQLEGYGFSSHFWMEISVVSWNWKPKRKLTSPSTIGELIRNFSAEKKSVSKSSKKLILKVALKFWWPPKFGNGAKSGIPNLFRFFQAHYEASLPI